jgi:D-aminoacyl-tRNA deacylase
MRAVVQRVSRASVKVEGELIGQINKGLLVLLGIEDKDMDADIIYMAEKVVNLRIFEDKEGKMNLSLMDIAGELLVISQFTLYGDCRKGRRPSFISAARPEVADRMYLQFVTECKKYIDKVETGKFQADMEVELINNGPVTLMIDSKKAF